VLPFRQQLSLQQIVEASKSHEVDVGRGCGGLHLTNGRYVTTRPLFGICHMFRCIRDNVVASLQNRLRRELKRAHTHRPWRFTFARGSRLRCVLANAVVCTAQTRSASFLFSTYEHVLTRRKEIHFSTSFRGRDVIPRVHHLITPKVEYLRV